MSRTETLDNTKMTNGPITSILLSFAGPVLLGQLMLFLYRFMYRNKCSCVTDIWCRKEY